MWICSLMSLKLSMRPLFTTTKSCQLFTHHLGGHSLAAGCRKFEGPKILARSQSPLPLPLTPGIHKNPKRTWAPTEPGIYLGCEVLGGLPADRGVHYMEKSWALLEPRAEAGLPRSPGQCVKRVAHRGPQEQPSPRE